MAALRNVWEMGMAGLWDLFQLLFGANAEKRRIYREMVGCLPGERLLDFGCATGITAAAFDDCDYLGVDINAGSIRWAQYKYRRASNIKFVCGDVRSLGKARFHHILCAGTGHHLRDVDLVEIHEIMGSLLVDGGAIHFIDTIRTEDDSWVMKGLIAIDQGRYVRTASEYDKLFGSIESLPIVKRTVTRADRWFTKPSFLYLRLVTSREPPAVSAASRFPSTSIT